MQAPLRPLPSVPPTWVRTGTGGGGAFADAAQPPEPAASSPESPNSAASPELPAHFAPASEAAEPHLLPPPPPEVFATLRSEEGLVALTNETLELKGELFAWRELEGVDVQPVRWLLGVLLGVFMFCGFLLAYLQFWLQTAPAVLGLGFGLALLAWGLRGTNRWRVHRPGQQTRYFALAGPARNGQQLAREANRRVGQRHHETATAAAYWFQQAALLAPPAPPPEEYQPDAHPPA